MLILISPAKTMTDKSSVKVSSSTNPRFLKEAKEIFLNMAQFPSEELKRVLRINSKLAAENYFRFQQFFSTDYLSLQALLAYTGIVFKYINPKDFSEADMIFAQEHLRIASFGYGLLRPLDLIKPYRIEHDVKLPELGDGNMYTYWKPKQTQTLIKDVKAAGSQLIYLASMDVQPAFDWSQVEKSVQVITPDFKVWKNGKLQTIVIYAKMARGQMSRFIIKNKIQNPEELKSFSWEGFTYDESQSTPNNWTFIQKG